MEFEGESEFIKDYESAKDKLEKEKKEMPSGRTSCLIVNSQPNSKLRLSIKKSRYL